MLKGENFANTIIQSIEEEREREGESECVPYYSGGELICFRKLNRLRGYFIIFHGLDKKMRIFSKIALSDSERPTHSSQSQRCSNAKSLERGEDKSIANTGADKKGANGEVSSRRAD